MRRTRRIWWTLSNELEAAILGTKTSAYQISHKVSASFGNSFHSKIHDSGHIHKLSRVPFASSSHVRLSTSPDPPSKAAPSPGNPSLTSALDAHMGEIRGLGKYALISLTVTFGTLAMYYDSLLDLTLSILPLQKVHLSSAGIGTSVLLCLSGALFLCWPVLLFQAHGFLLPSLLPAERSRALSITASHLALSILALQLFPAAIGLSAEALDPHMQQLLELDASGGFESVLGTPAVSAAASQGPSAEAASSRLPQIHLDPSLDSMLRQIVKTALGTLLVTHAPLFLAPYLSTQVHDVAARLGVRKRGLLLSFLLATPWAGLSLERGALAFITGVATMEAAILAGYYWRRTRGLLAVLAK